MQICPMDKNNMKRIICYPLKPAGDSPVGWGDNLELKYSLRSLEEHWKGQYDEVVILTDRLPPWADRSKLKFIMAPRYVSALKKAVAYAGAGGDIVWMNDDIMFLKDTTWGDLVNPCHRMGKMTLAQAEKMSGDEDNAWKRRLGDIMISLHKKGLPMWKFSTHTPYWYEADKLAPLLEEYGGLGYKVAIENAYFNTYLEELGGGKIFGDKFRAERRRMRIPLDRVDHYRYLNLTDHGLGPWMRGFIVGRFHKKSEFEV
mgnify:CR=1 FL=1